LTATVKEASLAEDAPAAALRRGSADSLGEYAWARDRWLRQLVAAAGADRRVRALLLAGSLARGEGDAWSDLDLVVVVSPDGLAAFRADVSAALAPCGRRLLAFGKPRNAPAGGAYQGALWDVGHALPVWTDWYLWPAGTAAVPADTIVLCEDPTSSLACVDLGFVELLDRHRASAAASTRDGRDRLLTVALAAKYLGRGDRPGLARMLRRLGMPSNDPADRVTVDWMRAAAAAVAEPELAEAVRAVTRLVDAAHRSASRVE